MPAPSVAVYGASGHTGNFVVRELERRGIRSVAIGRAPPRSGHAEAAAGEWRFAACDAPDVLDAALRDTAAVINCAGPFLDTAPALIEAALRAGIHYLDITAEQRSVRQSLATYHDEAVAHGTVVLPAMAFFGGLADLLAADVTRGMPAVESIEVAVALDYWHPTQGTRKTGDRNTARRMVVADGRLVPLPQPSKNREWSFPEPFGRQEVAAVPLSEIVTIQRHIATRNIHSYMNLAPLSDIQDAKTPAPTASGASGQSSQRFVMDVRARANDSQARITASGVDIYAVTAPLVAEACQRILDRRPAQGGAYAPAELFDAGDFLSALAPHLAITRSREAAAAA